jgi:DNA-binding NarL/FixJ family response regulator
VLLVDDDVDICFVARTALELDDRFEVVGEGRDGADAIMLARFEQPDLVLLDLEMPWLDGAEAVPHIRRVAPRAVIALWTVAPTCARADEALAMGASVALDKSYFGAGQLPDHLVHVLGRLRPRVPAESS